MIAIKIIPAALSAVLLALITYLAYGFDQWTGMMAYTLPYLVFCVIAAIVIGAAWMPLLSRRAGIAALVAFAVLSVHMLLPSPSERILRSASIRMVPGTTADGVRKILEEEYDGSKYTLPVITEESDMMSVGLWHHDPGNATLLTVNLKDGKVIDCEFTVD